jgi:hypothetical protein
MVIIVFFWNFHVVLITGNYRNRSISVLTAPV